MIRLVKIFTGRRRVMQEEYRALGASIETEEIRETYDLGTFRANINYLPRNEIQTAHKHFLVMEAIHVMVGAVQAFHANSWEIVKAGSVAVFDLNEVHNMKTMNESASVQYPGADSNISAVIIAYKWIPPYLKVDKDEIGFIMQNDWFSDKFLDNTSDPSTSPVLRLERITQDKFWSILRKNNYSI